MTLARRRARRLLEDAGRSRQEFERAEVILVESRSDDGRLIRDITTFRREEGLGPERYRRAGETHRLDLVSRYSSSSSAALSSSTSCR